MSASDQQGSRLDQVRKSLKISQVKFSNRIGISQGYLSQVIKGRRNISYKILNAVSTAFPTVSTEWILTGNGTMFKTEPLTKVEEEAVPYLGRRPLTVQDLAEIILSIQAENSELRRRIEALERHTCKQNKPLP